MTKKSMLDKMESVKDHSQAIGEFLDWLWNEKNYVHAQFHNHDEYCFDDEGSGKQMCDIPDGRLLTVSVNIEQLLAEYFGIDLKEVEKEKRALLAQLRSNL